MEKRRLLKTVYSLITVGIIILGAVAFLVAGQSENNCVMLFLRFTHKQVAIPKAYSPFHWAFIGLTAVAVAIAIVVKDKITFDGVEKLTFAFGVVLLIIEIYKQLYYYFLLGTGNYNFAVLPLQLCSYSLYCYLLLPFLPSGKVKNAVGRFSSLYLTMGAFIVMFYPRFFSYSALNLHTMVWHLIMIFCGILNLFKYCYKDKILKEMLSASAVFGVTFLIANALNLFLTPYTELSPEPLNLFYISPFQKCNYVFIGDIQREFGAFACVICYALTFITVGEGVVYFVGKGINLFQQRYFAKKEKPLSE